MANRRDDQGAPALDGRRRRKVSDERILRAAVAEFAKRGFAGASMQSIAEGARTTKATIYANLGDKDALYEAVLAGEAALLRTTLLDAYAGVAGKPVPDQMRVGVAAIFTFAARRPDGFRLLLGGSAEHAQPDLLLGQVQGEVATAIAEMVRPRLERAGVGNAKAADLVSAMLVGMLRAAATTAILRGDMNVQAAQSVAESMATGALRGLDPSLLSDL